MSNFIPNLIKFLWRKGAEIQHAGYVTDTGPPDFKPLYSEQCTRECRAATSSGFSKEARNCSKMVESVRLHFSSDSVEMWNKEVRIHWI